VVGAGGVCVVFYVGRPRAPLPCPIYRLGILMNVSDTHGM
jgi:hypothetical protein